MNLNPEKGYIVHYCFCLGLFHAICIAVICRLADKVKVNQKIVLILVLKARGP